MDQTSSGRADLRATQILDAVSAVTADLELESVLGRVVEAACDLVDARYGALGVVSQDGNGLSAFVHRGIDDETAAAIGHLPAGRGILGLLIEQPEPVRLADITAHPTSYGFPAHHPPMHSFLGAPVRVRGRVFGNLYLAEKRGGDVFTQTDEEVVIGLAAVAGTAIEHARLYDELSQRERWRDAVLEVTTSALVGAPLGEVRERLASFACSLVDAEVGVVVGPHEDGLWILAASGLDAPRHGFLPAPEGPAWGTLLEGIPVRSDTGPVFGARPSLWVPLRTGEEVVAALGVAGASPFGDRDEALLEGFAAQASLVLTTERARADLQRMSLIEDRERIGRDLHDTVIQRLFATGLSLQATRKRAEAVPDVVERLDRAVDEIDLTVKEIRATIFALQSSGRAGGGLRSSVLEVVEELTPHLPRAPRVRFDGPIDTAVPPAVGEQLLPVLREALTNVAKHAEASDVEVELSVDATGLTLLVSDDGRGIPDRPGQGLGRRNLDERASRLGGEVHWTPGAGGRGTQVRWRVPLAG
ncbi:sensor histidine kinase [Egicoccus halophilus]|uniref:Histidine kinase n=1 Tax=Egicoccus halophilus TaxID=1670830 RepID=A0A8J3A703_9ACTN|nr:GAF domain-containing sensor histidine kinase [Egicoccus halophilus]GGI05041.1 histidine kinase [Egicoccus halophilus]